MQINNRLISFGYNETKKTFYIKTIDPEYLKILLAENPLPDEIFFELPESSIKQICTFYSLWRENRTNKQPEEQL